jgi:hypothetical protein
MGNSVRQRRRPHPDVVLLGRGHQDHRHRLRVNAPHLQDNLNIHSKASLYEAFPAAEVRRLTGLPSGRRRRAAR